MLLCFGLHSSLRLFNCSLLKPGGQLSSCCICCWIQTRLTFTLEGLSQDQMGREKKISGRNRIEGMSE